MGGGSFLAITHLNLSSVSIFSSTLKLPRFSNTMNCFISQRIRASRHFTVFFATIATYASGHCTSMDSNLRAWNNSIRSFVRQGQVDEARQVFNKMSERNTLTWNSMINGYVKRREISMARKLFDEMPERDKDVVSWNLMISGYVSCHGCGATFVEEGRSLFDQMPERDLVSWNTIISGYAKIGRMDAAISLFHVMPKQDVVSWNAMISGFLQNGDVMSAIDWFEKMPTKDSTSLRALISGLIRNDELDNAAKILYTSARESNGMNGDLLYAYNTLIAGYGKQGRIHEAQNLFDQIPMTALSGSRERSKFMRDLVSWNTMIMCHVKSGDTFSARKLFDEMPERDTFSWNTMLTGYIQKLDMEKASELFSWMPSPDVISWNAMISGHAQMSNLDVALLYFERMPKKSIVSWNSMLAGCESNGKFEGGINLFRQMLEEGERPDRHTFSSILSISTTLVNLDFGMQIHQMVIKTVIPDVPLNNALVTMYSRCGALKEARTIFDMTKFQKDVITWNAMIGAYASHGYVSEALQLFEAVKKLNVRPTTVTFVSVLNACAQAGLVEEGRKYFESMVSEFGIEPQFEHFAALVNVFARSGQLNEAMALINRIPYKKMDKSIWGALLNACRLHNNVELARVAAMELNKLDPESSAPYVLVYNMFVDLKQWDDAAQVRKILETTNIKKELASSWI